MPGDQELLRLIDLPANQRDIAAIMEALIPLREAIKELSGVSIGAKTVNGVGDYKKNSAELAAATERLMALEKELQALKEKGAAKSKTKTEEELKQQAMLQIERQKAMMAAKDEIRLNQAAEESLNKKRIQLKQLQVQYDALAGSVRSAAEGEKLLKNIQALDGQVKALEGSTGRFQRNVGNYADGFKNFGDVGKDALQKVNHGFTDFFKNIASTAIAFIGIQGVFEFFKSSIEIFEKSEQSIKREENALKNLGASAKDVEILNKSITDLTTKYAYLSKVDLRESQQKLVTYGKLTGEQISAFLPTVVNFAANARISVGEATDVLIKGLEGNARAMKTYGINIKDATTTSERFSLIQTELAAKVAGSAQVFAESGEGKIEAYKRQLNTLKKGIGEQLLPVYEQFLDGTLKLGSALKQLDFGSIVRWIAALTGIWVLYKAAVLASNIATTINTSALIANKAVSEGMTVAKAAETLAEETNGKTKAANTILTYAIATAQRIYAAATRIATFEINLFGNAIRITPLGIFLTLLGLTITAFGAFATTTTRVGDSLFRSKQAQEAINEVVKKGNETFAEQKTVIDELVKKTEDHNLKLDERKKALKELIELDPKYLNGLTLENIETAKGVGIIDAYVDALHRKANAEAAEEILKADALKRTKAQLDLDTENKRFQEQLATAEKARRQNVRDRNSNEFLEAQLDGIKSAHKKIVQELTGTISEVNAREGTLDELLSKNKSTAVFNQQSGLGKYNNDVDKEAQKKELEYRIKLLELLKQEQIERLKVVAESKDSPAVSRLRAENQIFELEKELIIERRDLELNQAKITASEKAYIIEKANDDLFKKEVEHAMAMGKIYYESGQQEVEDERMTVKDLLAIREAYFKTQEDLTKKLVDRRKNAIDEARAYELRSLEERFANGEIDPKEYEKQKTRINNEAEIFKLKADEDMLKKEIALAIQRGEDITALQAKYADKEKEIEIRKNAAKIKSNEEAAAKKKKIHEAEAEIGNQLESATASFVDAAYENRINSIQKEINASNAQKETEVRNIEASTLSASQKAATIQAINEKQAAAERQLEAKRHQEQAKQAIFDRDAAILKITANTLIGASETVPPWISPEAIVIEVAGAAAIASLLTKKIPGYEVGTDNHPGGLMVVHPGELRVDPDGAVTPTPDRPTLTYGEPGTRIIPAHEVRDMMMAGILAGAGPLHVDRNGEIIQGLSDLKQEMKRTSQAQINAIRKMAPPVVNVYNDADFQAHIKRSV